MTTAEEVDVEMGDGFAAVRAVVDRDAETGFREAEVCGKFSCGEKEVTQSCLVFQGGFADSWDGLFGDDENVGRCLWGNVAKCAT